MAKTTNDGKTCAILSYLIVGIIWYFADDKMRNNEFAKFHAKQGLNLLIISFAGNLILGIIPIIGWMLLPIFGIAIFILWIMGLISSINGEKKMVPIIGQYADKYLKF